jgi:hypothetical protein
MAQAKQVKDSTKEFGAFLSRLVIRDASRDLDYPIAMHLTQEDDGEKIVIVLVDVCDDQDTGLVLRSAGLDECSQPGIVWRKQFINILRLERSGGVGGGRHVVGLRRRFLGVMRGGGLRGSAV